MSVTRTTSALRLSPRALQSATIVRPGEVQEKNSDPHISCSTISKFTKKYSRNRLLPLPVVGASCYRRLRALTLNHTLVRLPHHAKPSAPTHQLRRLVRARREPSAASHERPADGRVSSATVCARATRGQTDNDASPVPRGQRSPLAEPRAKPPCALLAAPDGLTRRRRRPLRSGAGAQARDGVRMTRKPDDLVTRRELERER